MARNVLLHNSGKAKKAAVRRNCIIVCSGGPFIVFGLFFLLSAQRICVVMGLVVFVICVCINMLYLDFFHAVEFNCIFSSCWVVMT